MEAGGDVPVYRWQVMVVREMHGEGSGIAYEKAGRVSETRTFEWTKPTPTPTPTSTPAP